ncbi:MAG: hypothetical protein ACR2QI_00045 [Woeseiaceae bacterium]
MRPVEIVRAIAYPVTESSVLIPLIVFWLLVSLAIWAGVFGLVLLFLVIVPAVFRFQMIVLEARAKGVTPETPGLELFNWFGQVWTLFPFFVSACIAWAVIVVAQRFGTALAILPVVIGAAFFPASIAVLAITHSPLQSLNPVALGRLWNKCGATFWVATLSLAIASWLGVEVRTLPMTGAILAQLLLSFAFFSLVGSLIEPYGLIEDIDIPAPLEKDAAEAAGDLEKARTDVLNHAYGFISRENRAGGFKHVFDWIHEDPDPVAAWAWFFDRMLRWEKQAPALFFAQHYLHDQLQHGEQLSAVKLIMRCRLIDEQFRPLPEDILAAIAACDACANPELTAILRRN